VNQSFDNESDPQGDYVTLTVVVKRDGAKEDPCDMLRNLRSDIVFVGHQDGITPVACQLGADPSSWI
jgi:hypothetical protein